MVAAVIAILAGVAIPQYGKAVERSRWFTARDLLLTIYAGEQVYQTTNSKYVDPTTCTPAWRCIYMDNPDTAEVTYSVSGVTKAKFTAKATYTPKSQVQTLDQDRTWGGTWAMP